MLSHWQFETEKVLGKGVLELGAVIWVKSVSENFIYCSTTGTRKVTPSPLSTTNPPNEGKLELA
jgi:hypothetical protein